MDASSAVGDPRALESLLAFWIDAGVDALYRDTPHDRLAPGPQRQPAAPPAAPAPIAVAVAPSRVALTADAADAADLDAIVRMAAGRLLLRGPADADVLFLSDGPDVEDLRAATAFSGLKGSLLDTMLGAAGLGARTLIVAGASAEDDARAGWPLLERLLEIMRPRAVLAAGSGAARVFFPAAEPILRLRGRWTEWRPADAEIAAPVLATLSPMLWLGQPGAKKLAWMDVLSLAARLEA